MNNIQQIKEKVQNLTVLFIDDEEEVLNSTVKFLRKIFKNVITANNGEEGLCKFKENPNIDLIITDVIMPKLNGINMAYEIVKNKPNINIIFLTASIDKFELPKDFTYYYMQKPVEFDAFLALLKKIYN